MLLGSQISILEWFLKNHVTLKTGVMAAENSALPSQKLILFYLNKCLCETSFKWLKQSYNPKKAVYMMRFLVILIVCWIFSMNVLPLPKVSLLYTAKKWKLHAFNSILCLMTQLYQQYIIFSCLPSFSCRSTLCNDVTSGSSSHNTAEVVLSYRIHTVKPRSITVFCFFSTSSTYPIYILHSKSGTQRASRNDKRKAQHNEGYSVLFEIGSSTSLSNPCCSISY